LPTLLHIAQQDPTTRSHSVYLQIESLQMVGHPSLGQQSFSIVLPKAYAINLGIGKGDYVKVSQDDGKIIIEKIEER
jgi:AbrB family looped-hinge helix DNA binding protein